MARLILPYQQVFDLNGDPLPGAKMYFYESGTVTPKDTYSDEALTTPNTNPVIADSQGQFGDIFLSGAYSVKLTDANDVTQPDYPGEIEAAADTSSTVLLTGNQTIAGVKTFTDRTANKADTPIYELEENDAPADNRLWQFAVAAEQFVMRVANDVRGAFGNVFTVDRTGNTVDEVDFLSTSLKHNGVDVLTTVSAVEFDDSGFRVFDNTDNTKKIAFEVSGITTGTTRTTTMPDKDLTFDYGTYTPSFTGVSNIDSVSSNANGGIYMRVGNTVSVVIPNVIIDPTAAAFTSFRVDLPIASNFGNAEQGGGTGTSESGSAYQSMRVSTDSANDEMLVEYVDVGTTIHTGSFTFIYTIV
jgi:hypothetical protein